MRCSSPPSSSYGALANATSRATAERIAHSHRNSGARPNSITDIFNTGGFGSSGPAKGLWRTSLSSGTVALD